MDGIREQLVKREQTHRDGINKLLIMLGSLVLAIAVVGAAGLILKSLAALFISAVLSVGILAGGWFLAARLNVEYEYSAVGADLVIDKIINRSSRKSLCEVPLKRATAFMKGENVPGDCSEIFACGEGERYVIVYDDEKYGHAALIFTPDERMIEAISPYLPRLS